jgi:hypothetical protein
MKEEFKNYLGEIDISSETLLSRVESLLSHAAEICAQDDPIKTLFVCNSVLPDGTNQFGSLWFFSSRYLMEARDFQKSYDIDLSGYQASVGYCRLISNSPDLAATTKESKMNLQLVLDYGTQCMLEAAGHNCSYLWKIYKDFIKPNIV